MRTPLYDRHVALGARMVDFAGWEMPVQYAGILAEHHHTRAAASVFDTCHMSEFRAGGPGAAAALRRALACRLEGLIVGRGRYGFVLNERGGVIDDVICYRTGEEEFMVVANASRHIEDSAALAERLSGACAFEDLSAETAMVALQGPASFEALSQIAEVSAAGMRYFDCTRMRVGGVEATVTRTGYTGELGYEIYTPAARIGQVWDALLSLDAVEPAGLGARDTLRLEMGYPLYGHELNEATTPLEAGCGWALPAGADYVGGEALAERARAGPERRLAGIVFEGRRAAREGAPLFVGDRAVGTVTSGCFAPSIDRAVALAYVAVANAEVSSPIESEIRGKRVAGRIVRLPFYANGSLKVRT